MMTMTYTCALYAIFSFGLCGWLFSFATRHYSHVDCMWSLFMVITAYTTAIFTLDLSTRAILVLIFVTLWALRLSIHIGLRNWGKEDHRYETIRENNEPFFWFKSLYIVFGFQAMLAWLISYPLNVAIASKAPLEWMDAIATAIFLIGFYWEVAADFQLSRFRANPVNDQAVMNTGLWRYSRHPNYFGECLIWWSFALLGASTRNHWVWISPVIMTFLLLRVSGVRLMEQTIESRRPAYADYVAKTNAFIPGLPKS